MTTTDPLISTVSVGRTVPGDGAACAAVDAGLKEAFFSTDPGDITAAWRVCSSCPVQLRCLAGALVRDEQWGVWGGWVFEPRIVRAVAQPVPDNVQHDHQKDGGRVRWEVVTIDLEGRRRRRGRFATEAAAVIAADRWVREARQRVQIGHRLGIVLDTLVPDAELHPGIAADVTTPTTAVTRHDQSESQSGVRPLRRVLRVTDPVEDGIGTARVESCSDCCSASCTTTLGVQQHDPVKGAQIGAVSHGRGGARHRR